MAPLTTAAAANRRNIEKGRESMQGKRIRENLQKQLDMKIVELEEARDMVAKSKEVLEEKCKRSEEQSESERKMIEEMRVLKQKLADVTMTNVLLSENIKTLRKTNLEFQTSKAELEKSLRAEMKRKTDDLKLQLLDSQKESRGFESRVKILENQIKELVENSPTGGHRFKTFSRTLKQDTKDARCAQMMKCIKNSVGPAAFDDFCTELCHYIAKKPEYSFKLVLSELDCFLATVKWRFSDGFLRDFKQFLSRRLGFDPLCSRTKIHHLRKLHSGLSDYKISVKNIPRKIGTKEIHVESAIIEATDLNALLVRRLERLYAYGHLKFDGDNDDIVLGIAGDKGGAHTKLVIVIGNTEFPNNPHGLLLAGMYEGSDDYKGLSETLGNVFHAINNLSSVTYNEGQHEVTRRIVKLPIGDCKFLSSLLGHGGQSCSQPCFLCDRAWTTHGKLAARLSTFDFSKCGRPYDTSTGRQPLFDIDLLLVGPPGVHTILGIVQGYFIDWLFAICNKIDTNEDLPENLKDQKKLLKSLKDELDYYEEKHSLLHNCIETIEKMIAVLDRTEAEKSVKIKITDEVCIECTKKSKTLTLEDRRVILNNKLTHFQNLVSNNVDLLDLIAKEKEQLEYCLNTINGPTRQKLERVLRSIGCDLRVWYQQLTGNQARNILRSENIKKLLEVFPADVSDNIPFMDKAMNSLAIIMSAANNKKKTDQEIDDLEEVVEDFIYNLQIAQPQATVSPKLHLLSAHLIPFLRRTGKWAITEQGMEHLHSIINSLNVRFASIPDQEKKATAIVKAMSNYNYIFDVGSSWIPS